MTDLQLLVSARELYSKEQGHGRRSEARAGPGQVGDAVSGQQGEDCRSGEQVVRADGEVAPDGAAVVLLRTVHRWRGDAGPRAAEPSDEFGHHHRRQRSWRRITLAGGAVRPTPRP